MIEAVLLPLWGTIGALLAMVGRGPICWRRSLRCISTKVICVIAYVQELDLDLHIMYELSCFVSGVP